MENQALELLKATRRFTVRNAVQLRSREYDTDFSVSKHRQENKKKDTTEQTASRDTKEQSVSDNILNDSKSN